MPLGFVHKEIERHFPQCRQYLRLPLIAPRVHVFCVDARLCVNQSGRDIFEAVRFLADVFDLLDLNVPPLSLTSSTPA
jgi:hypothetical protein